MDKNYLIAGGSSGIGKACARQLVSSEANVVLVSGNEEKLQKVCEELGKRASYIVCDLSDLNNASDVFTETQKREIIFDGMIYSAGVANPMPIICEEAENVQNMMNVNCLSFLMLGKEFFNRKNSKKGSAIVAISSLAVEYPAKGQSVYAASKAALNMVVKIMAKEFVRRMIRVNSIMPSYVDTPMIHDTTKAFMDNGVENLPLGVIDPVQIATLAEFLLSDNAQYMTGASIPVSAGI